MFEGAVGVQCYAGSGRQGDLRAEQGREDAYGRGLAAQVAEEDAHGGPVVFDGGRDVVLEVAGRVAVGVGEREPQLHAVQDGGLRGRHLRVADAPATRHQIQFAGPHCGVGAQAVTVFDLAGEQPADGLEAGVRMRCDVHAAGDGDVVGAVVVREAPGADQRAGALREGAAYGHGARAAERYGTRGEDLDAGELRAGRRLLGAPDLDGAGLGVAHRLFARSLPWGDCHP